jgi:hypothetical protein
MLVGSSQQQESGRKRRPSTARRAFSAWVVTSSEADSQVLVFGGRLHACPAKNAPFNLTCCD